MRLLLLLLALLATVSAKPHKRRHKTLVPTSAPTGSIAYYEPPGSYPPRFATKLTRAEYEGNATRRPTGSPTTPMGLAAGSPCNAKTVCAQSLVCAPRRRVCFDEAACGDICKARKSTVCLRPVPQLVGCACAYLGASQLRCTGG